jgi:(Z)-2-((N-methylformamido)methylene)-5-hydroxybutyrolactone dehydrogenase
MASEAIREYPSLFVGGTWTSASNGTWLDTINPATGQTWARVAVASEADVDVAVERAHAALRGPWSEMSPTGRGEVLSRLADLLERETETLAVLETTDNGKPITDTRREIGRAAHWLRYYAGAADKISGRQVPIGKNALAYTQRVPIGVVAAITPWNSPLYLYSWKLGPALAAGNCVLLKPAEQTPVTALELARLATEAGLPPGVLSVMPGTGPKIGQYLVSHPGINKIAFTGESATAAAIIRAAAGDLKRVTCECGGKAPNIIFADADLDKAIPVSVHSAFRSTGQSCAAASRLFVQDSIYDEVLERVGMRVRELQVDLPERASTEVGPQTSAEQLEKTLRYISIGHEEGARLVIGGNRPERPELSGGYFVEPTVFADVDNRSRLAQEEIFGPVLSVIPFADEDAAVAAANDTKFGLVAGLWTADVSRAIRVAHQLEAGLVSVNTFRPVHWSLPYGGWKRSGIGRENGVEALDEYTELRTIYINL